MVSILQKLFSMKPESLSGNPVQVKVECKQTGVIVDSVDCGTDQKRADKQEALWLKKYHAETHHVYQSYTTPITKG